jgi:signal transduction histidine kinase
MHSRELEKRFLHRDGTIVWGQLNASLARDSDGSPRNFISQIQDILVSNGVKFSEQGSVHVSAGATGDGVTVSVRDTGIGIASEDLPHIFEAFRQVDSRLARRHEGAGLGIAIAQKLAELMSGIITVESTPGKGSAFTLSLPASPPAAGSPSPVDTFPAVVPVSRVSSISPSA